MKTKIWKVVKEISIIFLLLNVAGALFALGTITKCMAFSLIAGVVTIFLIVRVLNLLLN